jgi:hypothetical protein
MRECLLSCVEQALYDKSVEKRLGDVGSRLRAQGAAKQLTSLAKLKLRAKGLFSRRHGDHCCC